MLKKLNKQVMDLCKKVKKTFLKQPMIVRLLIVAFLIVLLSKELTGRNMLTMLPGFSNNLEGFEGDGKNKTLVYLYWKDCGHCKEFTPKWDEFSGGKNTSSIKTVKFEKDSAEGEKSTKKYNVSAFPFIVLVDKDGGIIKEYDDERTVEGLQKFVAANDA